MSTSDLGNDAFDDGSLSYNNTKPKPKVNSRNVIIGVAVAAAVLLILAITFIALYATKSTSSSGTSSSSSGTTKPNELYVAVPANNILDGFTINPSTGVLMNPFSTLTGTGTNPLIVAVVAASPNLFTLNSNVMMNQH
jgi:hypothetical protein